MASGATAPGPALEGAPRFRPMSLSTLHFGPQNHSQSITRALNRFFCRSTPQTPQLHLTSPYEVKRKILSLKPRSAPGEDGITSTMLRNLYRKSLSYLTRLFNHLLRRGLFPNTWKRAKVIPIPKPNQPASDPNSYRPISLLSTVGKLFERLIARRLISFVNQQLLLPQEQFGFRKKTFYRCSTRSYF